MTGIRVVEEADKGPLDDQLRAMVERIIAQRPLAVMIVCEMAKHYDIDHAPRLDSVRRGLTDWLKNEGEEFVPAETEA